MGNEPHTLWQATMQINEPNKHMKNTLSFSLFNLGFRIFFLFAGIIAVASIAMWTAIFQYNYSLSFDLLSSSQWHAHEMIYGYSLAVISGFLLTAVKNWTGVQTVTGKLLAFVFSLWVIARLLFIFGDQYLKLAAVFDILFAGVLLLAVAYPVIKVKQWNQSLILVILILLGIFNALFYLGALGIVNDGLRWGIYGGLYTVISLILIMGRRVIPFFIERGVGYEVKLFNSKWVDIVIIILLSGFILSELFISNPIYYAAFSLGLFIINFIRLIGWHTKGIWNKSMLWSIYIACWFISLGFLLMAVSYYSGGVKSLAIHAFTIGGIGLMTMGMMSRVALGHTGRDVSTPPKIISYSLGILVVGGLVRVALPLVDSGNTVLWIGISQILWIAAFLIFTVTYFPILSKPRIDNQPG